MGAPANELATHVPACVLSYRARLFVSSNDLRMTASLTNRQVLLGITGGIAAYKAAELARRLQDCGATVRVIMTPAAIEFITPLTLQALSGNPVTYHPCSTRSRGRHGAFELARWADVLLAAPASADFMARLAQGASQRFVDDRAIATRAPCV